MVFLLPLLETMIQSCILLEWVGFFSLAAIWLNVRCIYLPRLPVLPFCSTFKMLLSMSCTINDFKHLFALFGGDYGFVKLYMEHPISYR